MMENGNIHGPLLYQMEALFVQLKVMDLAHLENQVLIIRYQFLQLHVRLRTIISMTSVKWKAISM